MSIRRVLDNMGQDLETRLLAMTDEMLDQGDYLNVSEAARFRGVSRNTIRLAVEQGRLRFHRGLISKQALIKCRFRVFTPESRAVLSRRKHGPHGRYLPKQPSEPT